MDAFLYFLYIESSNYAQGCYQCVNDLYVEIEFIVRISFIRDTIGKDFIVDYQRILVASEHHEACSEAYAAFF